MSLKKYSELTEAQRKLVHVMYSNRDTVQMYLYNFEGDKYVGRQTYVPDVPTELAHLGSFHLTKDTPEEIEKKDEAEDIHTGKTEPVKKVQRKTKKK